MTAWTAFRPGHFDRDLLPRTPGAPDGQGELFSVADVAETRPRLDGAPAAPELDGQQALFAE